MDERVCDYLDDKIQSTADLETLDQLLDHVKTQQYSLRKQLEETRRGHSEILQTIEENRQSVQRKALAFQQEQQDIDTRLAKIAQSGNEDDAVRLFEPVMAKLHKLELASGYMELLQLVESLRSACATQIKTPEKAFASYQQIQRLSSELDKSQNAAEGAAPHLRDFVAAQVQQLKQPIQDALSENLEASLKKLQWPKVSETIPMALQAEWTVNVGRLLELQKPLLEERELTARFEAAHDPPPLIAFAVLVRPLEQRFAYHFSGNKPTNRLEKPQFFFKHVEELISTYEDFIQNAMQPLLLRHFHGSDLAFTPAYIDATSAFITALLPMLKRKLGEIAPQVVPQTSLLSRLVQESITFDQNIVEQFAFAPQSPSISWRGLSDYLLDACGCFEPWLAAERDFALSRYHEIINAADAGEMDYDAVQGDSPRPTKAAVRINYLLETITERYRFLTSFSQKVRFLIDIQIEIFDQYFRRLVSGLDAYLSRTTTLGRTFQNMTKEEQAELQGVRGLDRLCRIHGSADYLERAMRDWSDEVFFLELWDELDTRARSRDRLSFNMGSLLEVQRKTSVNLGSADASGTPLEGALFDETAASYHRLIGRCEIAFNEALAWGIRPALKSYASVQIWASLSAPATTSGSTATISAELQPLIAVLEEYLGFLRRALGRAAVRRLSAQVCQIIRSSLWDGTLMAKTFSTAGSHQFAVDVRAICSTINRFAGPGHAELAIRKLVEAVAFISLPIGGKESSNGLAEDDDDDAAAWDDDVGDETSNPVRAQDPSDILAEGEVPKWSLLEIDRLVFISNDSARNALEQLGLRSLTANDARDLLRKRVEVISSKGSRQD